MYFLWSYWLPLYLLVVYVSISTSSSNSTHLSLSLLMFIVSDGLSILPFWRNLCSSLQSVQTVQIALSTWGVTITPALLLAILLKISITLTWAGYPVSWVPGSPPLWFILSISWSMSISFGRNDAWEFKFLRPSIYENIFTLPLDWWSGYRLLVWILFSFKIEGISYFLLTSWLLLRSLKPSGSRSFVVACFFVFLSGSLWDLFKIVGYFHSLYDLLVGFQVKEVFLILWLVISSPFLPLSFFELLL